MESFAGPVQRASQSTLSLVKQEFRKGYEIEDLSWQKNGILSRVLWPSKDHVIRIVPGHDPETGEIYRQNIRCDTFSPDDTYDQYLSNTFTQTHVVSRFGTVTAPFVSDYLPGSPDYNAYGGDTVIRTFIRDIVYSVSGQSKRRKLRPINEWKVWTGIGPQATMGFDNMSLLMQALVFTVNGRNNSDYETGKELVDEDGDIMPLLAVVAIDKKQSILNLCQALVDPMDPSKPLDAATNNKYGPMAELDGNKLYLNTYTGQDGRAALRPSVQARGAGWTPDPFPLSAEVAKRLWHPWRELLHFMTAEEQVQLCAREFGADTVNYVIGTNPKFSALRIPDEIRNAGLGRYAGDGGSVTIQGTLQQPSAANPPAFKPKGLGAGLGKPAAQPSALKGVNTDAGIDTDKLLQDLAKVRKAAGQQTDQAADASELLDEPILGGR